MDLRTNFILILLVASTHHNLKEVVKYCFSFTIYGGQL